MPKIASGRKRGNKLRGTSHPYGAGGGDKPYKELPDPKRPDLVGLKPGLVKKMQRKRAFLESVGASHAAASLDVAALRVGSGSSGSGSSGGGGSSKRKPPSSSHSQPQSDDGSLTTSWGDAGLLLDSLGPAGTAMDVGEQRRAGGAASSEQRAVKRNAAKQLVASKEVERLKAVSQHPVFQSNPHAAIREYLLNTLAAQRQQQSQGGGRGGHGQQQQSKKKGKGT